MRAVTTGGIGVGDPFQHDRADPEEIGCDLDILNDLTSKWEVEVSRIDPRVNYGHRDTLAGDAEFIPHPVRADQGDALVEKVRELAVVVDGPQPRQAEQGYDLRARAAYPEHGQHAERDDIDAGGGHGKQITCGGHMIEGQYGLHDLSGRPRLQNLLHDRIKRGGGDNRQGQDR